MYKIMHKIMIVDDESSNHRIMQSILEDDFEISSVYNGKECLEKMDEYKPDIVLLDIMMPEMDGYELADELKSNVDWADIPIVFVSAKGSLEDRLKGYEYGAVDYFIKPFEHDELIVKIRTILSYKKEVEDYETVLGESRNIAFQAKNNADDLEIVLRFIENSFAVESHNKLVALVLEATTSYKLDCCLLFKNGSDTSYYSVQETTTPLEEKILIQARDKARIFSFKDKTIFNYKDISLLVKNMPVDDEVKYGMVKDNVCYLLNGAQARVDSLNSKITVKKQTKYLMSLVKRVNSMMQKLTDDTVQLRTQGAVIVEDINNKMNLLVPHLGLLESQEQELEEITKEGLKKTSELFSEGVNVDEEFQSLISKMDSLFSSELDVGNFEKVFSEQGVMNHDK